MPQIRKNNRNVAEILVFPLLVFLCLAAYFVTVRYRPYEISAPAIVGDTSVKESTENTAPLITETKCAKLSDGKIGIYDCYGNLEYTLFTDVTFLPRADRMALSDGIVFESESALCEFIESLDS